MKPYSNYKRRRGGALIIALVTLLVVMLMAGAIVRSLVADHRETRQAAKELQARSLADAALARGMAVLTTNPNYAGETWRAQIGAGDNDDIGVAEIRVERPEDSNNQFQLTVEARYPDHPWRRVAVSRSISIPRRTPQSTTPPEAQETAP